MTRLVKMLAALSAAATIGASHAAALLGSFEGGGTMGHSGMPTPHGLIEQQMFLLSYSGMASSLEDPETNAFCIGCSAYLPVGWTGSKTFDESTDGQAFRNFLGILGNAINESMFVGGIYRDSTTVLGGGFGSAYESELLAAPATLASWHVEYVVLTVFSNEVYVNTTDSFTALPLTRWEFWGTAVPIPPTGSVPEPASLALVALSLVGIAASRRRRPWALPRHTH